MFVDQNGVSCFIDQNGATCWVDQNGIELCCAGATPIYNKFNQFTANLANKVHNLGTDVLKLALSDSAPIPSNTVFANIIEIAAGNGYTAGGSVAAQTSSVQSGGTYNLILTSFSFTASGGAIGPFRYLVLYNSTPSSPLKPLIAWYDLGIEVTLANGEGFPIAFDPTNGVLYLS